MKMIFLLWVQEQINILEGPELTQFECACSVAQLCPTVCHPMDCSLPESSVHGIFQARILEWVAIFSSRVSSGPRYQTHIALSLFFLHFILFIYLFYFLTLLYCIGFAIYQHESWIKPTSLASLASSKKNININSYCCSATQLCLTLCDPMDCSMPVFLVLHHLPELAQTHAHWVGEPIQPSHPLSSPSPPALNLSQHQGLFKWVGCLHQVAEVLELQL